MRHLIFRNNPVHFDMNIRDSFLSYPKVVLRPVLANVIFMVYGFRLIA